MNLLNLIKSTWKICALWFVLPVVCYWELAHRGIPSDSTEWAAFAIVCVVSCTVVIVTISDYVFWYRRMKDQGCSWKEWRRTTWWDGI